MYRTLFKKIFVLEDNEGRVSWFKKTFNYADKLFITKDCTEAIKELSSEEYDIVFLDHDLEEISIYDESSPNFVPKENGLKVAEYLKNTINSKTVCIVHSMNPVGAVNMVKAHTGNVLHVPFHTLRESIFIEKEKNDTE